MIDENPNLVSPKISVILVVFNNERYIEQSIYSVLNQDYENFELIVHDDGSTDATPNILKKFEKLDNFKVVYGIHTGNIGRNRNLLAMMSSGSVLAFIDSDDIWRVNKLSSQVKYINDFSLVCCNASIIDDNSTVIKDTYFPDQKSDMQITLKELLTTNYILTSSVVIRRESFFRYGGFEETLGFRGEDYLLWLEVSENSRIVFMNSNLLDYRVHSSNLSYKNDQERIKLLKRTVEIRSRYVNIETKSIKKASLKGCAIVSGELSKLYYKNHEYTISYNYSIYFLKWYSPKLSLRYLKFLFITFFLLLLKLMSRGNKSKKL
ncbi:MAG: glycosyltransferase [Ignavibacteria bacterium]|nr:glycosyltransferase [Ignavibacteria bacterium]